jgi:glycyl-tRNA synthetase
METLYDVNGLAFWSEKEVKMRRRIEDQIFEGVRDILLAENSSWSFQQIEAPILTPRSLVNPNYTADDVWESEPLVMRPETTPSSYRYAEWLLENNRVIPPFVIWQAGKSFRKEQDQVSKNMRLKEFYQQEFQCIYASDTLNDYQEKVLEPLRKLVEDILALPTRVVPSDRLPSYSMRTVDLEVDNGDKWMEVCSISKRTDFTMKKNFGNKEKTFLVLEIAMGLDRLLWNYFQRRS